MFTQTHTPRVSQSLTRLFCGACLEREELLARALSGLRDARHLRALRLELLVRHRQLRLRRLQLELEPITLHASSHSMH